MIGSGCRKRPTLSSHRSVQLSFLGVAIAFFSGGHLSAAQQTSDLPLRSFQNIFDPLSTPAKMIHESSLLVLIVSAVIFVVVSGLMAYAIWKFRARPGQDDKEPAQVYGSIQIEMAWAVIPIIITVLLILVTARSIGEIQNMEIPEDAERIRLVGHQWWWEVHYPEHGFVTANEIHVPVDEITHFELQSADVIHSFWVPQLAGKTDCIPNRTNETWIEPFETGIYLGNCAEYCGTQHAGMRLRVIVQSREAYDAWVANQKKPAVEDPAVAAGKLAFEKTSCVNCHRMDGTLAKGVFGPDLTHLASRQTIAAGEAPLNPESLREWLRDPQTMKPGALMPDMKLTPQEVNDIADYLMTLK